MYYIIHNYQCQRFFKKKYENEKNFLFRKSLSKMKKNSTLWAEFLYKESNKKLIQVFQEFPYDFIQLLVAVVVGVQAVGHIVLLDNRNARLQACRTP